MSRATGDAREQRLDRLIGRLPQRLQTVLRWLRKPSARWLRILVGVLLIFGSVLSILPLFGLWMLPLGLLLSWTFAAGCQTLAPLASTTPPHAAP